VWCGPKEDALVLKSRRGFIRLGLERGLNVVPCYTFGETDVLCPDEPKPGSKLFNFQRNMQQVLGLNVDPAMPLFPRQDVPVSTIIGSPLQLPKISQPTEEEVDVWLHRYINALKALHSKYEPQCTSQPKRLRLLEVEETLMP